MSTAVDAGRVTELEKALQTKTAKIQDISDTFTIEDNGGVVVSEQKAAAFKLAVKEAQEIRELLHAAQGLGEIKSWMNAPRGSSTAADIAAAEQRDTFRIETKSLGDFLLESKSYKAFLEGGDEKRPFISLEVDGHAMPNLGRKDIYGGAQTPSGGTLTIPSFGGVQNVGITEARLRQKHIRDLFPKASTTAAVLYGVRETGFTNNAAQVNVRNVGNTDFVTKPHSDLALAPVMYPVATVAHWIKAHSNILKDEPRLKDFINRRMVDGVMLAEDRDLLFSVSGGESMTGIMNTPGIQTYTGLSADKFTKQIRKAATRAMLAEYEPNGIVLHPLDWESLELEETGDGHYRIAINVAVGGEKRIWSMDIVSTTAMTQGKYLLGAFGLGAQIYDREKVNVLVSTEDDKNFQQNLITIRAEERLALTVDRPEAFVNGTLTTYVAP